MLRVLTFVEILETEPERLFTVEVSAERLVLVVARPHDRLVSALERVFTVPESDTRELPSVFTIPERVHRLVFVDARLPERVAYWLARLPESVESSLLSVLMLPERLEISDVIVARLPERAFCARTGVKYKLLHSTRLVVVFVLSAVSNRVFVQKRLDPSAILSDVRLAISNTPLTSLCRTFPESVIECDPMIVPVAILPHTLDVRVFPD